MLTSPIHLAISAALRRVGKLMEFILFSQIRERGTGRMEIVAWSGDLASRACHDSVPCEVEPAVSSFREAKAKIDRIAIECARNFEGRGSNPKIDGCSPVGSFRLRGFVFDGRRGMRGGMGAFIRWKSRWDSIREQLRRDRFEQAGSTVGKPMRSSWSCSIPPWRFRLPWGGSRNRVPFGSMHAATQFLVWLDA